MNAERQQAIQYLRAPAGGLWRWSEGGSVLVWQDGTTIAFREEVVQLLEVLAPNGLPSFGALVLLLAAGRGKWPKVSDLVVESGLVLSPKAGSGAAVMLAARRQLKLQIEAAIEVLARVSRLPGELRSGLQARCLLAEAVFESAKVERHIDARDVLAGLRHPLGEDDLLDSEAAGFRDDCIRHLHVVANGLKPHTAESLALRLRTGLDALPVEANLDVPAFERARRLIEDLSRDQELGPVARAARVLMAAVRLPRRLGERDQLAIGGVADLTNRGPLDRLLLSELAHDDLTLAVRVALNEALYLRREPPVREPPGRLVILLDSGVRLWGIPRVLAAGVALALIARDKQHGEAVAWRAGGERLEPVELLTRNGLIEHLGVLETGAHPARSLNSFDRDRAVDVNDQVVLITHPDTLADAPFRRALADQPAALNFVATVERDGRFELHALPLAHRPPLCEADLELDAILHEPTGVVAAAAHDPSLPAIFGVQPFPLLVPVAGRVDDWTKTGDGLVCAVINGKELVRFRDHRSGARVLARELPGGKTIWMGEHDGVVHVVKAAASQRPARLVSLAPHEEKLRVVDLVSGDEVRAVHQYGDVILLIRSTDVRAHALHDGRMVGRALNPHTWVNGRYFRGSQFYFAAWDGQRVKFEPVTMAAHVANSIKIAALFDRDGLEGPWAWFGHQWGLFAVTADAPRDVTGCDFYSKDLDYANCRVSRSGHRLAIPYLVPRRCPAVARLFDLNKGKSWDVFKFPPADLLEAPQLPAWNLFRAIDGVARLDDVLALRSRKGRWRKLTLGESGKLQIKDLPESDRGGISDIAAFSPESTVAAPHCELHVAEWSNGSRAFLDSRGLLHLKSHEAGLVEISIVPAEGEVAGWTSDHHVCGPKFFFEGEQASEPERVFDRIQRFLWAL